MSSDERNIWQRFAQGRATVRNQSMRKARHWKRILQDYGVDQQRDALRRISAIASDHYVSDEYVPRWVLAQLQYYVSRARRAHRDWRKYRAKFQEHLDREARFEAESEACRVCGLALWQHTNKPHEFVPAGYKA